MPSDFNIFLILCKKYRNFHENATIVGCVDATHTHIHTYTQESEKYRNHRCEASEFIVFIVAFVSIAISAPPRVRFYPTIRK